LAVPHDASLVLAVSGGPDSTALLHGMNEVVQGSRREWRLVVAHLDHGLRDGSEADASRVADAARLLDIPFRMEREDVAALAR
jgi:tRNA(Ile)-lysidine synthase